MKPVLEFFFDFMSPYSYLSSVRVDDIAERQGTRAQWKPVHLPGIVKATKNVTPILVPAKGAHMMKDLNDWTQFLKLPSMKLPENFANESMAYCNRVALCCGEQANVFAKLHFHRIFAGGAAGNDPEVIRRSLAKTGLDVEAILAAANSDDVKAKYRAETEAVIARGAFGLPTFFVGDDMYVGNDRLDFVERALERAK